MFRLFVFIHLSLLSLYACDGAFTLCVDKIKDSQSISNNTPAVIVKNNKRIVYTHDIPNAVILKYDPFLSLYLVKDRTHFKYPFTFAEKLQLHTAILNEKEAKVGRIIQRELGLNYFGKYSKSLSTAALILNSCCELEAIVTPDGVIEKAYLKHFLKTKNVVYGDIGIRVRESKNGKVVVNASDPFMPHNPFEKGDVILAYNGKKVQNAALLMQQILFAPIGSKHDVKIKRGTKYMHFHVKTDRRYGGGYLSDTFLERRGIYFDKNLHIISLGKEFKKYGLKVGDRVEAVNEVTVTNQEELRLYLEKHKDYSLLLLERNNFEFFVNIKKKKTRISYAEL